MGSSRESKLLEGWGHPEGVNCWRDGVIQREYNYCGRDWSHPKGVSCGRDWPKGTDERARVSADPDLLDSKGAVDILVSVGLVLNVCLKSLQLTGW